MSVRRHETTKSQRANARREGWNDKKQRTVNANVGHQRYLEDRARSVVEELLYQARGDNDAGAEIIGEFLNHPLVSTYFSTDYNDADWKLKDRIIGRLRDSLSTLKYQCQYEHQHAAYQVLLKAIAPKQVSRGGRSGGPRTLCTCMNVS